MRLLLTSGGITNPSIAAALESLLFKSKEESVIAFVPTAANVEKGSKNWLIRDLWNLNKEGYKYVDIVDISALSAEQWTPRLEVADVIFFGGGNTFHLLHWLHRSGLDALLPELLKTRVYGGISAGSMLAGRGLTFSRSAALYYEEQGAHADDDGLGLVDFAFIPHLHDTFFTSVNDAAAKALAAQCAGPLYVLDDQMALSVRDGIIEKVGEGTCITFND